MFCIKLNDVEGEMDQMLTRTEETVSFTSVLVPTLSWDPVTDREIITRPGSTWVEEAAGLMPREGARDQVYFGVVI